MLDDKDKNPKKTSDTGTKDKKPRTVSETDTLRKRAKIVKEAPTGPEWEKITSDGEEIYVKRAKGSEPDSTSRRIEKKPIDINKVKTKYVGPPPKYKPKKDVEKRKTPPTKTDEDEVVRVVKDEEEPNIPTSPTPTEPTPTPPPTSKPNPKQTGLYGSISTYEKIDPAAQWGADYGITTFTFPDAEGRYTNTSRTVNIDKEGNEIAYDLANPLNSFKDGKFTPTLTGRTIEDVRNEWSLAGISKPTDYSGNKANSKYEGSLMMPGTKATRIAGGGGGEFNQRSIANTPNALKGAPTGYIEQKYDSEGKPIFTPNQGVQFNEENVTPLREGEMEVGKMYDIPNTTSTIVPNQNKAKGGKIMAPKMKKYVNAGVVQVPGSQGQTNTGNVPLTQEQIDAKKKKNDALVSQLGSAAMTIGNQLNQQPIDYSASEKQRQNADVANVAADQALSATVPYYGLVTGAWDIANSMTAKDKYGEAKPGINAAISEMTTNPIEGAIKEASKGNVLGALRESSGWGKIGRAGMQVIGKGEETKGFFGGVNKALGTTDRKKAGEKYMAEQLAEAKAKDTAYKQSQAVANRDAGILEGAQVQGLYDLSSPEYDENRQLILKPGYAKGGVIGAAKMMYAKGGTIVGKGGPKDDAIFTKANKEGIEPGSFIVPAENNEKAKGIRAALFGDKNKVSKFKKGGEMESNVAVSNGEHLFTPKERKKIVNYLGEEILEELAPNAEENSEEMSQGGLLGTLTDRENMREYKGGGLTKSKARTMLHEGMANGKPITEQQRKYFGWVAGGSKESKMDGGAIHGYAMGTGVEGVEDVPVSKKTYAELITPPTTWRGTKEQYKAAVDKSIKEGKTIPKGGVTTAVTTKSVAAPSVKKGTPKSKDMTPETMERKDVALEELRKMDEAQGIKKEQSRENVIMTTPIKDVPTALPTTSTSPPAPRKGLADYVKNIDPGAAFSAYQIGQGSKLLKSGQRPEDVSKIDPAYNAAVERAQRDATFGYTPEQAAMLDQKAINALNDARFSGRNLAGGSAGTAFQQERQAINQGWSNALQLKSADQQLRMQKQQYADQAVKERADFLDTQRRRAFGDAMNTYNINQESGSALVGAGVRNAIGSFRYQKELEAQERAAKIAGVPIKTD